ncbi:metallophosphoesterase [Solidesulfovibrio carbinoliphilus subsp. oakridgensis]|uniref:Metallophosphoesterase n=1 Tax=Solidesulfovibrio carbinoliphilus subsp. oakridgensis TaxID=694327 RepID=G7Q9Q7_9BACT|nr:metallophosphoesterase [Solidesulfovibrio carbinoliphilus]EHJ49173.1 metallophosphoesterase [Solidesulfovibrio carbinoliphilus subsp. oakridgensis]
MTLPTKKARGLLCIPDPHVAGAPPMQRLESFMDDVLSKLAACLDEAAREDLVPVVLGDLFHWPRENPNTLMVALIELFRPHHPFVLVGNHDKYQARFTADTSLAVLRAAGVVEVLEAPGLFLRLETPTGTAVIGASPDGAPLPASVEKAADEESVWLTHHGIGFPDYLEQRIKIREIPGLDWVINGHMHRPQPTVTAGATRWANPGNITRLHFSRRSKERVPMAAIWRPGADDLERWPIPHRPFEEVFPDQEFPPEETAAPEVESRFLEGLARLAWRRTREGAGLREFLSANLNPENPETKIIWELYREVTHADE